MRMITLCRLAVLAAGLAVVMLVAGACDNPFDPLEETDEIKGLTYFDWAMTWERWDSDPEYDGVELTMEYFNQYGDSLEFRDKGHTITVEFYTEQLVGADYENGEPVTGTGYISAGDLIFTHSVTFKNTDDDIRIPKELYADALRAHGFDITEEEAVVYGLVHIFPPKSKPQAELVVGYPGQTVYKPDQELTPNP